MVKDQHDLVFSLTAKDFDWSYSTSTKSGGQRRDRKLTKVSVRHEPSGAKGESQDERSQAANKHQALVRLTETTQFRSWVAAKTRGLKTPKEIEQEVLESINNPDHIKLEVKDGKNWKEIKESELS